MYGNKLRTIRKHLSATQEEMAKLLQISYRSYTSYERDENNPPYSMLVNLCKNQKINLNWFIASEGDMILAQKADSQSQKNEFKLKVEEVLKQNGLI